MPRGRAGDTALDGDRGGAGTFWTTEVCWTPFQTSPTISLGRVPAGLSRLVVVRALVPRVAAMVCCSFLKEVVGLVTEDLPSQCARSAFSSRWIPAGRSGSTPSYAGRDSSASVALSHSARSVSSQSRSSRSSVSRS